MVLLLVRHPFCVSFGQMFHNSMSSAVEGSFNLGSWLQSRKLGNHQTRSLCGRWWHPVTGDESSRESALCLPYHVSLKYLAQAAIGAGERKHYLTHVSSQVSLFLCQQRPFVAVDICHAG